ncbi:MAG TPA: fumarate hydratase [Planctomycetes bacterium]|nr:fumarate hydratase [Planctomycetota bacterium]HIJ71326.1 fumarate hydratase [Planctomycetota bacterium]
MRKIPYEKIVGAVERLCIDSCYELPEDVLSALKNAAEAESNRRAKRILTQLIENARIAADERIPLCQDTGLAVVFVEQGSGVVIEPPADYPDATLFDAINEGIQAGYENGLLRKSVVAEPLNERINTGTNTPAIIHHNIVSGHKLTITVMTKGGGCENKSRFKMFKPTAEKSEVIDWVVDVVKEAGADACPPFVVGVGMGGDFEHCCLLSKKSLLRKIGDLNSDKFYAEMESLLLAKVNATGLGPQGLGGDTTALAVHIETAPCHIASLPVAVNIECHAHRHKSAVI